MPIKSTGGSLGTFGRGQMVKEFDEVHLLQKLVIIDQRQTFVII